jgi:hypothetical protein
VLLCCAGLCCAEYRCCVVLRLDCLGLHHTLRSVSGDLAVLETSSCEAPHLPASDISMLKPPA